jgi:hypothetical protein
MASPRPPARRRQRSAVVAEEVRPRPMGDHKAGHTGPGRAPPGGPHRDRTCAVRWPRRQPSRWRSGTCRQPAPPELRQLWWLGSRHRRHQTTSTTPERAHRGHQDEAADLTPGHHGPGGYVVSSWGRSPDAAPAPSWIDRNQPPERDQSNMHSIQDDPHPSGILGHRRSCLWRRLRGSNPRGSCPPTRFPGVCLRPLGQASAGQSSRTRRRRGSGVAAGPGRSRPGGRVRGPRPRPGGPGARRRGRGRGRCGR